MFLSNLADTCNSALLLPIAKDNANTVNMTTRSTYTTSVEKTSVQLVACNDGSMFLAIWPSSALAEL